MPERFAPSPNGFLHLGHAFSALTAWRAAQARGDMFLLRIEDIDTTRSRAEYEAAIYDDLAWLGIRWPQPVMRQSDRMPAYESAINQLISNGLCYPCACTRRDITAALSAPQEGADPAFGPDGPIYPGTCRHRAAPAQTGTDALRLNMAKAVDFLGGDAAVSRLNWQETGETPGLNPLDADALIHQCGDIVLARRDIGTSYHLAVVVDDAAQGITHVTRGRDMAAATAIHRVLQALLDLPTQIYHHHRLIRDATGKRLAKRDDARSLRRFRADGATPQDILNLIGLEDRLA